MSEEDALKMCTLNPAKMLHIDDKVGSVKVGKDADLVLWSDNPLSIYAKALKTMVDGIIYFDRDKDAEMRKAVAAEKARLIQKLQAAKRGAGANGGGGGNFQRPRPRYEVMFVCGDHYHKHGLLTIDSDNLEVLENSQY